MYTRIAFALQLLLYNLLQKFNHPVLPPPSSPAMTLDPGPKSINISFLMRKENETFFYDMHCHLQDKRLLDKIDCILHDTKQAGVDRFLVCGTREDDWPLIAELARRSTRIFPAFGLHPWYSAQRSAKWREHLGDFLQEFQHAAVGEAGLDNALDGIQTNEQEQVLLTQLHLAAEMRRPICLHCRRAWNRLPALLKTAPAQTGILLHSFSGSPEIVKELADLPVYFSFSGSITYKGNRRAGSVIPVIPVKQLLLETDAPDMLPEPARSTSTPNTPSTPAMLPLVFNSLASLRPEPATELKLQLAINSCRFLGLL